MAGEVTPQSWLRIVTSAMDAMRISLDDAMDTVRVPDKLREGVRELDRQNATVTIERVRGVSAEGGPKQWYADYDPADGYYWQRQRQYLLDHVGRTRQGVEALDDDSNRVLSHMEDPRATGPDSFRSRGLVVGHIQSGKTENFSALTAKAADLGYQVIIVLAGVHNGLRQQTQRRLERELGLTDVGVGLPVAGRRWNNPTTADLYGDFNPGTSDPSILQGNEKVIFVVKKWHTILDKLIRFIRDAKMPAHVPVLVVDDEADQASINTGGNRQPLEELIDETDPDVDLEDEADPSKTNAKIREILGLFQRVSYVAYTATPFANILINHEAEDREVFEDLFPEDFILTLGVKPGYIGTTRLFGRDALEGEPEGDRDGLDVVRFIPDWELSDVLPVGVKVADFHPAVPASLDQALTDWLLATGGLIARDGDDKPSSMLIHIHQQTRIQNELKPQVEAAVSAIRQEWRYGGGGMRDEMRARWDEEFRSVSRRIDADRDMPFEDIEEHINRLLKDGVPVLALNSYTDDILDYEQYPGQKAVIIGGNRLSRGMTLEGLTVSYYVRETPYFDTLLQMGRWFGYRESYVDLTRLYTTTTLASWFRDLALREEELRQQIDQAERDGLSPKQVGYRIRSHPAMMVTAQNKMGAGRVDRLSYAGRMIQTTRFRLDEPQWLQANLEAARSFAGSLGEPGEDESGVPLWRDISWQQVCDLLERYQTVQDRTSFDAATARRYILAQVEQEELRSWQVAISTTKQRSDELGNVDLEVAGRAAINAISRSRLKADRSSIGALTNPAVKGGPIRRGDEEIGLTDAAISAALHEEADGQWVNLREALLAQRDVDEGLLVLYPISRYSKGKTKNRVDLFEEPDERGETVIGLAIGFPRSESAATVEYVFGSVGQTDDT